MQKKLFLVVNTNRPYFSDVHKTTLEGKCSIQEEVEDILREVVLESYVVFGGIIYKQYQGIPMGGDASA